MQLLKLCNAKHYSVVCVCVCECVCSVYCAYILVEFHTAAQGIKEAVYVALRLRVQASYGACIAVAGSGNQRQIESERACTYYAVCRLALQAN
jgi:hypothetical protein